VGLNAQKGLAKSHETGDVQKRIRCELVELHTVNKQKPTEKLVGRKRETAEEESKEHYPITARGLRDPFSTGEFDGIFGGDEAVHRGLLHLLLCDGGENQLVAEVLAMVLLVTRCFTCIQYEVRLGAMRERRKQRRSAMEAVEETSW
jgi:hypothetical protein